MFSASHHQLLRALARSGPASRTALAELTGLSKPAISVLARELIASGVVSEAEPEHGLGRPALPLTLRPEAACFLGISLREHDAQIVLSDLVGTRLGGAWITAPDGDAQWTVDTLASALADAMTDMQTAGGGRRPAGAGIAVPGFVDLPGRTCIKSTLLGWQDVALAPLLEAALGMEVRLENDAHALARGLQVFGPLRGASAFTLISVGEGVGSGHIVDGRLLRGHHGGAGEIAHAISVNEGAPCRCGKRGCLDTVASLRALSDRAKAAGLPGTPEALERAAASGDGGAVAILHDAGTALGLAAAQVVQALDPEALVIGLDAALGSGVYGAALRRTIAANVLPGFAGSVEGTPPRFMTIEPFAWAEGAASVAAHRFLWGAADGT